MKTVKLVLYMPVAPKTPCFVKVKIETLGDVAVSKLMRSKQYDTCT